jgi:catechol-2,3-dioxygenase
MAVHRLNHAVLYVRDADRTATFYEEVFNFRRLDLGLDAHTAVFMVAPGSTNDHDLGLFSIGSAAGPSGAGRATVGLYHLAWEVDTLDDLDDIRSRLTERGSLVGSSDHGTTKSLYGHDPDGLEFEVAWVVPADRINEAVRASKGTVAPLDLAAEKQRFGATTPGGVGISRPAPHPV